MCIRDRYIASRQVVAVNESSDIYTLQDLAGKNLAVQSTTCLLYTSHGLCACIFIKACATLYRFRLRIAIVPALKRILHAFYIGADLIRDLGLGALGRKRRQKGSVLGLSLIHICAMT